MAASDVYLFPSYREGMPATVLEAMAYGMGVITSRSVGSRTSSKTASTAL